MDVYGAAISALGQVLNSAGSMWSGAMNRKSMRHAQNRQFKFAREQSQKMIDLVNSAHQREVSDLRAAGLNPILSAGGSGAGTPSLPTLSAEAPTIGNPAEGIASTARDIARYLSQDYAVTLEGKEADVDNTRQNTLNQFGELQHLKTVHDRYDAEMRAEEGALNAEYLRNQVDKVATSIELGIHGAPGKDGRMHTEIDDPQAFSSAVELAREGVRSAMKVKANENMRAWINSAGSVANSAAHVIDSVNPLNKFSRLNKLPKSRSPKP